MLEFVKQANRQTNNKYDCVFGLESWLGILTWILDLGSWIGTSNASNLHGFPQS